MTSDSTVSLTEAYQQALNTARRLLIDSQTLSGRLHHLQRIVTALQHASTLEEVLTVVRSNIHWLFQCDHCSVSLKDTQGEWANALLMGVVSSAADANHDALESATALNLSQPLSTLTAQTLAGFSSHMIIPLQSDVEILGVLNFGSVAPEFFSLEDRRTAQLLAAQLTYGLRHIQLLEETQRSRQEAEGHLAELAAMPAQIEQMSYAVAHDLKSPLNLLQGYISLLQLILSDNADPDVQTYLGEVEATSKNMARIIDQLMWLAQLDNARDAAVPVDMVLAAQRTLWRFHLDTDCQHVTITIDPTMPRALGQEGWIEEVFANLIGNALKYMGDDQPNPQIQVVGQMDDEHGMARYEVIDNGVGIAPADQTRIFQTFARLRLTDAPGHGMGLSIASRIIQRLGGQIGVHSALGEGSTFWFTLPAA